MVLPPHGSSTVDIDFILSHNLGLGVNISWAHYRLCDIFIFYSDVFFNNYILTIFQWEHSTIPLLPKKFLEYRNIVQTDTFKTG